MKITGGLKAQSDVMSAEDAQLLLPKLTDEQLATLKSYGTTEQTSVGQVLAAAGDLDYDLVVVLDGEVECSDLHDGRHRALLVHGPRDFIAELDLLTGQRSYATFVVIRAGSIIRVRHSAVESIMEADAALGELLVQTMFRRREALLLLRSGIQLIGSRYSPDTQRLRPRRRRVSRTTSGSPRAYRALSSPSAPACRRSGWERRCSCLTRPSRCRIPTATTT
jgi:thioredoxin reductase (NADPH)